jgi:Secretion system C-terminal sorting domain
MKTTNGGINWSFQPVAYGYSIFFLDANTGYISGAGGSLYKTTNCGNNWNSLVSNTNINLYSIQFINPGTGYAVGGEQIFTDNAVLKTTDGGSSWHSQVLPTRIPLYSLFFTGSNTGYVGGVNGTILKTTTGGNPIFINPISSQIPQFFFLHQNYPNPFNPVTKIKFDLPKSSNTKIMIYDVLGRLVTTLVNENLKPGSFEVEWDGSWYASGVYFYSLVSEEFVETRKMVLLK